MINMRTARLTVAFLVAPASPVLVYYLFIMPKDIVFFLGLPLSYIIAAFVGIPLFFWARKKVIITRNKCIKGGFIAGVIFPLTLAVISLARDGVMSQPIAPIPLLLLGTVSAIVFGLFGAIAGYSFSLLAGFKRYPFFNDPQER